MVHPEDEAVKIPVKTSFPKLFFLALVGLCFRPAGVLACGACYGAANSTTTQAMNWAILVMIGVTGSVFAGIGAVVYTIWKRTKMLSEMSVNLDLPENDAQAVSGMGDHGGHGTRLA